MKKIIAILLSASIVVVPLFIVYYLVSKGVILFLGKEMYAIIVLFLALIVFVERVFRKFKNDE